LAGGKVGRRETGRPGIDNLGPARERSMSVDQNVLFACCFSRKGHCDRDGTGRPVPAFADHLPVKLRDIRIAEDAVPDPIANPECPLLVSRPEIPLGPIDAA
jgi:hypothetical protein